MSAMTNHGPGEMDVLVVGAGPAGLTAAGELLQRGVRCRLIDKSDAPATTSRALGMHSRTLELLERVGMVDRMLARGVQIGAVTLYDRERVVARIQMGYLRDVPYPYALLIPQQSTEAVLLDWLGELGGAVERSTELVGLQQDADGVTATIVHVPTGTRQEVRARYLIGCDGAHSAVRKALGLTFAGTTFDEEFLLGDVDLDWERNPNETHGWLAAEGLFAAMPLPHTGQWRLFAQVAAGADGAAPRASVEAFQQLMAERTGDTATTISHPTWLSNFRFHRRIVDAYRRGRGVVAGDAAHIHSPFGGQGMNTGMQDAINLAWKLALVLKGRAGEHLLDTYQEERMPIGRQVLADTSRTAQLLIASHPALRFFRDRVLVHLIGLEVVQLKFSREASELDINYRRSSLARSHDAPLREGTLRADQHDERPSVRDRLDWRSGPHAGDRAPQSPVVRYPSGEKTTLFGVLGGTRFHLLLFDGRARTAAGYADLVSIARQVEARLGDEVTSHIVVAGRDKPLALDWQGSVLLDPDHEAHRTYGAGAQSLYLVRPDWYIGFRGQPAIAQPLMEYLSTFLRLADD